MNKNGANKYVSKTKQTSFIHSTDLSEDLKNKTNTKSLMKLLLKVSVAMIIMI